MQRFTLVKKRKQYNLQKVILIKSQTLLLIKDTYEEAVEKQQKATCIGFLCPLSPSKIKPPPHPFSLTAARTVKAYLKNLYAKIHNIYMY